MLQVAAAGPANNIGPDLEQKAGIVYNPSNTQSGTFTYDALGRVVSNRQDGVALISYNAFGNETRVVPSDLTIVRQWSPPTTPRVCSWPPTATSIKDR